MKVFGFIPNKPEIFKIAFTHRSEVFPSTKILWGKNNERLEFLGDSVLGSIVAEFLFRSFPEENEGFLTEMRSKIVNRQHLNELGDRLGLKKFIQLNKSLQNSPQPPKSLLGDAFEAFIGAVYIDKGYSFTREFVVNNVISDYIDIKGLRQKELNYKSKIIEWAQQERKDISFNLVEEIEDGSGRVYIVEVLINGEELGRGTALRKKDAEQKAAEIAFRQVNKD